MLSRRGFFAALSGVSAGAAVVAVAHPATSRDQVDGVLYFSPPGSAAELRVIHRACRIIGVLAPGECLAQTELVNCGIALHQMLDDWNACGAKPRSELEITHGLAIELAGEFGPRMALPGPRGNQSPYLPFAEFYDRSGKYIG